MNGLLRGVPAARGRATMLGDWNGLGWPPEMRDKGLAGECSGALLGLLRQLVARENLGVRAVRVHHSLFVCNGAVDFTVHLRDTQFTPSAR